MSKLKEMVLAIEDSVTVRADEIAADIAYDVLGQKSDMKDEMENEAADHLSDYDLTLDDFIDMYGEEQWFEMLEEIACNALDEHGIST